MKSAKSNAQRLREQMTQEGIIMAPGCHDALSAKILEKVGFEIETFGTNTILIRAIPAWLGHRDPRRALFELVDEIKEKIKYSHPISYTALEELAKILACKVAIKVHHDLSEREAYELINQLSTTKVPFSCPHGRPIIVTFTFRDFEKLFNR